MSAAAFDTSVIVAALVREHPEHTRARALVEFVATGLADVAMACPAPAIVAAHLVGIGADERWATERARDVLAMFRMLDVTSEDATQALADAASGDHAVDLTAASLRRHGVRRVVAAADRLDAFAAAGIAEALSIADTDARIEVLIPEGA